MLRATGAQEHWRECLRAMVGNRDHGRLITAARAGGGQIGGAEGARGFKVIEQLAVHREGNGGPVELGGVEALDGGRVHGGEVGEDSGKRMTAFAKQAGAA
ncbi:hypothetical protein [Burkholderia gladioli]|uniref:hypothetical protein n=1 Tax=Burkholderia gladioli TaxID=28095 RepID=UPI001F14B07C|nr:hypothetical protein [Burkholderia gladioli]